MKIKVTDIDILAGQRERPTKCPIAFALRRYGAENPLVTYGHVFSDGYTMGRVLVKTTPQMLDFIKSFDAGKVVAPFEFEAPDDAFPKVIDVLEHKEKEEVLCESK